MSDLKQISRLYSHSYLSFIATFFGAILVVWVFQTIAEPIILISWFVVFSILTLIRIVISYRFQKSEHINNTESWLTVFLVMTFFSGVMWGLTGFLLIPEDSVSPVDSVLYYGMLLLFIVALITGSVITYSASKMVYLCFAFPAIVPQCLMLILKGDLYHTSLGGFVLAYAFIIFVISVYIHRIFSEVSKIEAENDALNFLLKKNGIKIK